MDKRSIFLKSMAALSELFDKTISETFIEIYWRCVSDFDAKELQKGFARAARECKFFPKPVELRDFIGGTRGDKALIAWLRVADAHRYLSGYKSVDFQDARIHAAIEALGGWPESEDWPEDTIWTQKEFERIYLALPEKAEAPPYLKGRDQLGCEQKGREWRGLPVPVGARVRQIKGSRAQVIAAPPEPDRAIGKLEAGKILKMLSDGGVAIKIPEGML